MLALLSDQPLLTALSALLGLGAIFGALLGFAAIRFRVECGYPGCRPYSEAIADGDAINKCPPGGDETIQALADLLDVEPQPLDAEHGVEKEPVVASIREDECIGCTKCIQACPVDAILGAAKVMHTVIADECTGCDLCIEPCPVDCIDLVPRKEGIGFWHWPLPQDRAPRFDVIATDAGARNAA